VRLLFDSTAIPADRGGVGRYVECLLPSLATLGVEIVVVCQQRDASGLAELVPSAEIVLAPLNTRRRPVRLAWEQLGLPSIIRRTGVDLVHSPHYTMTRRSAVPVVVTLHDATFFSHPALHSALKARFFRAAIRTAVSRADAIVVPSQATSREIRRFAGGDPKRFHVAYHGVDEAVFHPVDVSEQERVARTIGAGSAGYVGFLGTLEPRKNVPALVRAWSAAVSSLPDPPDLVLAGARGWDAGVGPAVAGVPAHGRVIQPGYLPLEDLPGFLGGARLVAYPSLGEGFGLPVLEAMACGAAVLTTRELSLPEVGGEAVAYCGVDEDSIRVAMMRLLADEQERTRLGVAAVERARGFTWDASARQHVAAYEGALTSRTN
jgi:glycosyltransferase involved in cell wall biosynthesis